MINDKEIKLTPNTALYALAEVSHAIKKSGSVEVKYFISFF